MIDPTEVFQTCSISLDLFMSLVEILSSFFASCLKTGLFQKRTREFNDETLNIVVKHHNPNSGLKLALGRETTTLYIR